ILMVPTLIASFYGMNVPIYGENMPHGFAIIVMISITLSALSFFIFRKIKWF
ncbi:MAG: magnesium transporter CorA family protein, partial [Parabacteroides sp.]|nr:magnesium transporter CorA family protein [Parabacteroides sp.]